MYFVFFVCKNYNTRVAAIDILVVDVLAVVIIVASEYEIPVHKTWLLRHIN